MLGTATAGSDVVHPGLLMSTRDSRNVWDRCQHGAVDADRASTCTCCCCTHAAHNGAGEVAGMVRGPWFHNRVQGVGGDQCVCWYDQWLKTQDPSFLAAILRYNEDDCWATFYLKNWLVEFF